MNQSDSANHENRGGRPAEDSSFTLLRSNAIEAVRILVLRRWAFFVPFCVVTCAATVASHWIPRTYSSSTLFERRDHAVLMNLRQTAATGGFVRLFRPTLARDITDIDALTEVVQRIGLVDDLARNEDGTLTEDSLRRCRATASRVAGGLNARLVQREQHFDQIEIGYTGPEPYWPQVIVNEVKNTYIRRTRKRLHDMLTEAHDYFDDAAEDQRKQISLLERDLLSFQAKYIGVDPTNPGALQMKITSYETEEGELTRQVAQLEREIESRSMLIERYSKRLRVQNRVRRDRVSEEGKILTRSPESRALELEVQALQREIHDLQLTRRMTDRHPDIIERRKRLASLHQQLKVHYIHDAEQLPANRGMALDDELAEAFVEETVGFDVQLADMKMQLQDRINVLASTESRQRIVREDLAKHRGLSDNVYRHREEFQLKSEWLEQARTAYRDNSGRALEIGGILDADSSEMGISFSELTRPTPAKRPIKPRGSTAMLLALLAGLAGGAICVLLCELFDQTYHTTKQVTRSLSVAILESIDEIVTYADRAKQFRRRLIFIPVLVGVLLSAVGIAAAAAYLSIERPTSYQRLRSYSVKLWNSATGQPRVMLTDPHARGRDAAASLGLLETVYLEVMPSAIQPAVEPGPDTTEPAAVDLRPVWPGPSDTADAQMNARRRASTG